MVFLSGSLLGSNKLFDTVKTESHRTTRNSFGKNLHGNGKAVGSSFYLVFSFILFQYFS